MHAPFGVGDGRSVARFMFSRLDDDFDNGSNKWVPHSLLGRGGLGTVGYWRKVDTEGNSIDEVAIKEQAHFVPHSHGFFFIGTARMRIDGIAEEAVFHAGLQVKEAIAQVETGEFYTEVERNGHIPPLRAYKHLEQPKKSRMYMSYAPHGTLQDILFLYKANDQLVPEPFAWAVLLSVVQANSEVGRGGRNLRPRKRGTT